MIIFEKSDITVAEYINHRGVVGKVWVCPHLVSTGRVTNPPYFCGIDCTVGTIPEEVKNKKVRCHFREMNTECIFWQNDEDYSYSFGGFSYEQK